VFLRNALARRLGRYLTPFHLLPARIRRRPLYLGSSSSREIICSALIAKGFDKVDYPVQPEVRGPSRGLLARHPSYIMPRDFDLSPDFRVPKSHQAARRLAPPRPHEPEPGGVSFPPHPPFAPGDAMLRSLRFLFLTLLAAWLPAAPPVKAPTLRAYFAPEASGLQAAGVRLIPIRTPRGTFRVWTKRFGHNPRIKLLLLHGGPGATHESFEALETWLGAEGIEFIYYDQLGSGDSERPTDDSLWTIDRFVDEVEQVRQALGLTKDDFYLLGHSWGGVLAIEYALKYPQNLKGLVISNMMASIPDYNRYAETVLGPQMDPAVLKEIKALEAKGQYESPRYMELLTPAFYHQHVCRLDEWPDAVNRAFGRMNRQVYVLMQGPSEFGASGRLEHWDRKADLPKLAMPTLVIGAAHDTMDPAHMKWMAGQVPHGSFLLCPKGSHMAMWDDQAIYATGLIRFLEAVDAGKRTVTF
jgi:proline iminopeptidase